MPYRVLFLTENPLPKIHTCSNMQMQMMIYQKQVGDEVSVCLEMFKMYIFIVDFLMRVKLEALL